jgi:hypothetical protein
MEHAEAPADTNVLMENAVAALDIVGQAMITVPPNVNLRTEHAQPKQPSLV